LRRRSTPGPSDVEVVHWAGNRRLIGTEVDGDSLDDKLNQLQRPNSVPLRKGTSFDQAGEIDRPLEITATVGGSAAPTRASDVDDSCILTLSTGWFPRLIA
jgi:hypothetical protein